MIDSSCIKIRLVPRSLIYSAWNKPGYLYVLRPPGDFNVPPDLKSTVLDLLERIKGSSDKRGVNTIGAT